MQKRTKQPEAVPGLAGRIRERREELRKTQNELARAVGVSFQAVSKWERGANAPEIALLPQLADALDVSTDWLLGARLHDFARRCYLFQGLSDADVRSLLGLFATGEYAEGEQIFAESTQPNPGGLFLIESGSVRFEKQGTLLGELGPGDVFSDYSFLDGGPCITRAIMLAAGAVHNLSRATFENYARQFPQQTIRVLLNEIGRVAAWHREHD